jgi:hypothetical protein
MSVVSSCDDTVTASGKLLIAADRPIACAKSVMLVQTSCHCVSTFGCRLMQLLLVIV